MKLLQAIKVSDMVRIMIPEGARYASTQEMRLPRYWIVNRPDWCCDGVEFDWNGQRWRCEMLEPGTEALGVRVWTFGDPDWHSSGDMDAVAFKYDPESLAREYWDEDEDPGTYRVNMPVRAYDHKAIYCFVAV